MDSNKKSIRVGNINPGTAIKILATIWINPSNHSPPLKERRVKTIPIKMINELINNEMAPNVANVEKLLSTNSCWAFW